MSLTVAVQMDPIHTIDISGDSTFAILLAAAERGHTILYYEPRDLFMSQGKVQAHVRPLTVRDEVGDHYLFGERFTIDLTACDVVLLRQDPPFDMAYITTTHLLERVHPGTLVVNDPTEVRNAPEKLFVLDFVDLMPPTLITRTLDDVRDFQNEFGDIIIKPLYGNGGTGVVRLRKDDGNLSSVVELFQGLNREPFMVQQFRSEVAQGDKRIILIDGEVAGAINRKPAKGETRSNLHVGGTAEPVELSDRDREICARLGPALKERGLIFTGIDVIGSFLTEINVTSPTGIRQVKAFGGNDIAAMIWDAVEAKLRQ